jgi:hypothetical protein
MRRSGPAARPYARPHAAHTRHTRSRTQGTGVKCPRWAKNGGAEAPRGGLVEAYERAAPKVVLYPDAPFGVLY